MKLVTWVLTTITAATLVACGGGGGGTATVAATNYTGQYVDAPVQGLSYTASPSGLTGTTDASGNFSFQAGDTVTFNIVTPAGNISAGSVAPATPTTASTAVPISVMSLSNGTQIAQTLQSLGGTGSTIDVSSTNAKVAAITAATQVTDINNFLSTGGASTQPAVITVKASDATNNALTSISSLSSTAPTPQTVKNMISGSTVFYISTLTTVTVNGVADTAISQVNAGIDSFKTDGKMSNVCVNGTVTQVGTKYNIKNWSSCTETPDLTNSTWSPDATSNKFTVNNAKDPSSTVVTVPVIDTVTGLYSQVTTAGNTIWAGNGLFYIVNNTLSTSTFSGKTVTTAGNSYCSDGYMNYVISTDGSTYTNTCKTSSASTSKFTSSSGTISTVTDLPGVLKFNDSTTKANTYVGQINGGSLTSGRLAVASVGDSTCYSSTSVNCGYVTVVSYTAK